MFCRCILLAWTLCQSEHNSATTQSVFVWLLYGQDLCTKNHLTGKLIVSWSNAYMPRPTFGLAVERQLLCPFMQAQTMQDCIAITGTTVT